MPADRIEVIRERRRRASRGPWRRQMATTRGAFTWGKNNIRDAVGNTVVAWPGFDGVDTRKRETDFNAVFVANAWEDIGHLLDVIDELRQQLRFEHT